MSVCYLRLTFASPSQPYSGGCSVMMKSSYEQFNRSIYHRLPGSDPRTYIRSGAETPSNVNAFSSVIFTAFIS